MLGHGGKCRHLHGHRYVVEATVGAQRLDHLGMVVDFGAVKEQLGAWLDEHWDHGMLLCADDPVVQLWQRGGPLSGSKLYVLPHNPTAEYLAEYLATEVWPALPLQDGLRLQRVVVRETPNCWAEWRRS